MSRWLYGTNGKPVFTPEYGHAETGQREVSFLDFVQALSVRAIRTQHNVSLAKIREAVEYAEKRGFKYPFARYGHKTYLVDKGRSKGDIVLKIDDKLLLASGKQKSQMLMKPIIEIHLQSLEFDPLTGFANRYTAFKAVDRNIVMDPHRRFGEPMVEGVGYSALALWEAARNEGGIKEAAQAYGVDEKDVIASCLYFDYLLGDSAS